MHHHLAPAPCFDRKSKKIFYFEKKLGIKRWSKPKLLGPEDLAEPKDEFRAIRGNGGVYYFNPATGEAMAHHR